MAGADRAKNPEADHKATGAKVYDYQEQLIRTHNEWKKFVNNRSTDSSSSIVPQVIFDSWIRCRKRGVDPYLKKVPIVLDRNDLKKRQAANRRLIEISLPYMNNLYKFLRGSGFVLVLTDSDVYILEIIGDEDVKTMSAKGNLVPGACWNEEMAGTSGGTAMALGIPIQVYASEHYCINSHRWACSAAPIRNPEGEIIGGLNMSGPYDKANPHTLGMVVAATHAIENHLKMEKSIKECQLAYGFQNAVIESISEAMIAISADDVITLANKDAKALLNMTEDSLMGKNIRDLLGNGKNRQLLKFITGSGSLTDIEVKFFTPTELKKFIMSSYPIVTPLNKEGGRIITFNESKRAQALVTRMIGARAKLRFADIIGKHPRFLKTVELAKRASATTTTVLLTGKSGTGKDIFAQAIHNESRWKNGPYVAVNCAAIPRDLIASEFFGYANGAFTGSQKGGNQGKFELADGGTLFLDEISEIPLELQATLLRAIEDKVITRIGGRDTIPLDVRIIAATNKNLREEVKKGNFREDLYYRINVLTIEMIPLCERKTDIPLFIDKFIEKIGRALNLTINRINDQVLKTLEDYAWPGNVRELQNVLEKVLNIIPGSEITMDILPPEIIQNRMIKEPDFQIRTIKDMEQMAILQMLHANNSKNEIARKLNISRNTLYRRLEKYGLQ